LLLVIGLATCAKPDGSRILGHWRAEQLQIQSIGVPMGPDFVLNRHELTAVEGDLHIPITSLTEAGDTVTVEAPFGISLSFTFESADRMYFDLPLVGRIHYRRIHNEGPGAQSSALPALPAFPATAPLIASATPPSNTLIAYAAARGSSSTSLRSPAPELSMLQRVQVAELEIADSHFDAAEHLLLQARELDGDNPMVDYHLAILRVHQSDHEAAIHHLDDAFNHGFRAFSLLEASPDLAPLKADPRYAALIARYR
jgi:predicted secreted protein